MARKPDQLKALLATVPGVSASLDDPHPTTTEPTREAATQPAEPLDVPDSLAALLAANSAALDEIKAELDSQAQVRDERAAKRAAARAKVKADIEKAHPLDGIADTLRDHEEAMVRREVAEALRFFDQENPPVPQVAFAVAEGYSVLVRHGHQLRDIACRLGPGVAEHARAEHAWEAACKAGADQRFSRERTAQQAKIRAALEHEEHLEDLREQARNFGMLDKKTGKLSRVPT